MTPSRLITGLLLICGMILVGCQTRPPMGEITTAVEAIKLTTPDGSQGVVTLRYLNDNIVPVAFDASTHQLYLNGTKIAEITNTSPLGLAQISTTTRNYTVDFTNPALVRQLDNQEASYRLETKLTMLNGDSREYFKNETNGLVTIGVSVSK